MNHHALKDLRLRVEYRPLSSIIPDPANPRKHPRSQIRRLMHLIKRTGFLVPILIDATGKVIAGHARVEAAQMVDLSEIPTICLQHLTSAEQIALMVGDNRSAEGATWDDELLATAFTALMAENFDLNLTCFDPPEIDFYIEGMETKVAGKSDRADQVPALAPQRPVCRPGDRWQLMAHRILCADSLQEASYDTLLGSEKVDAVFTDPPYNVRIKGHVTGNGAVQHAEFAMASGEMSSEEFEEFLLKFLQRIAAASRPGALHYICMDWRHLPELQAGIQTVYGQLKNLCVWVKTTAGMGSFYRSQHELVAVCQVKGGRAVNNVQLGKYGRNRSNVWTYTSPSAFGHTSEEGKLLAMHPTVKPVQLVADALLDCTARKDAVLDAFLGSGTTLMAAERIGRPASGLEGARKETWRLPAIEIEQKVETCVKEMLGDRSAIAAAAIEAGFPEHEISDLLSKAKVIADVQCIERIDLSESDLMVAINIPSPTPVKTTRSFPLEMKRRGVETRLVVPGMKSETSRDPALLKNIGRAMKWWDQLLSGEVAAMTEIAQAEGFSPRYVQRLLPLAMLAPDVVEAIAAGEHPVELTADSLTHDIELPIDWKDQRTLLGFDDAHRKTKRTAKLAR